MHGFLSGYLKITDGNKGQFNKQKEWKGKKIKILYTGKISPPFYFLNSYKQYLFLLSVLYASLIVACLPQCGILIMQCQKKKNVFGIKLFMVVNCKYV